MLENAIVSHIAAERAIDELRRQRGIAVREANGQAIANYPLEFINENMFSAVRSPALRLLITAARAEAIGLPKQDTRIEADNLTLQDIMALGDPLSGRKPPSGIAHMPASEMDSMALKLVKYASLLPALLLTPDIPPELLVLEAADLRRYLAAPVTEVLETARAQLPIEGMENTRIISFRVPHSTAAHLALLIGEPGDNTLTRIHSSCVTGDILGSLRCDCGDQLALALEAIRREGAGVLVYLHQEGRGIGIANKLRAYRLQERGMDTYEANLMLGFEEDERDFSIAAAILKKLGIRRIRLLTNNPQKISALEKAGIEVSERVKLAAPPGKHNHGYLEAKGKAGHLF